MSSQIDSQNIDKTFPVAGQDNNSQGFRDNFDAIQRNFQFAKGEIEDLQTKALLKSPLGSSGTIENNLGGSKIVNGGHTNFHGTAISQANVSSVANINVANGDLQSFSLIRDTVFTFVNWPATDNYAKVRIHFRNNSSAITVGNDIVLNRRYTIEEVGTTDFEAMGADPSARFTGTISGNILDVSTISAGSVTVGTVITGFGVIPDTQIIQQQSGDVGRTGNYIINKPQTVSLETDMTGMVPGIVFTANRNNRGVGSGTVKPWVQATLITEGNIQVVPSTNMELPLEINPSGSDQVVEAWTWTGSTARKVFVDYIGNLGETQSNFFKLSVGSLVVEDEVNSTDVDSGSVVVAGGVGVAKNLNVGGNMIIDGDLRVIGNTVIATSSVTIQDIGTISNVDIENPVRGDILKYDPVEDKWTNSVDLVEYTVTINEGTDDGIRPIFFFDGEPIISADLKFGIGKKYRFNYGSGSGQEIRLRFSTTPDIVVPTTITTYTDNVVVESNYVEIFITPDTPSPLYLYNDRQGPGDTTDLYARAQPIQVGNGPVLVVKNYTPRRSQNILVNTADNVVTITLPVNSTEKPLTPGTFFTVTDSGTAGTNNIIIDPGSPTATINGITGQRRIVGNYSSVTLVTDGTNWTMVSSIYNGSEDVAANSAISSSTSVSYFSTGPSPETATLPNGVEGQIKTLIMRSYENTMTVTTVSAGWRTDGNQGSIVFDKTGDTCILQFVQGKWHVISNNGCRVDGAGPTEMVAAPSTQSSTGRPGQIAFDTGYLYVCIDNNNWKSIPFTSTFRGSFNEGTTNLNSLSDVVISGPISGQVLKWDGVRWSNGPDEGGDISLNDLTDVTVSGQSAGQVLKWNGTQWTNQADATE